MMAPSSLSKKRVMTPMTDQELDAVTIVFHQFETGLREGTIYTKVSPGSFVFIHGDSKHLTLRNQDIQTGSYLYCCKNET